jgi:hypothetical protein
VLLRNDVDHSDGGYVLFFRPIVLGHLVLDCIQLRVIVDIAIFYVSIDNGQQLLLLRVTLEF